MSPKSATVAGFALGRNDERAANLHEHHAIPRPALAVTLLALLLFPLLLILIWTARDPASRAGFIAALLSYEAVVLAVLGGAHWALATGPYGRARIAAEWLTGLACLITAWACLNLPAHAAMTVLIAAFFLVALRDVLRAEEAGLPMWFARLRSYLTAAAIVSAILALVHIVT